MHESLKSTECGDCCACSATETQQGRVEASPIDGRGMAIYSAVFFLLPLACAVSGSFVFDTSNNTRFVAGSLGLFGGMVISACFARLVEYRLVPVKEKS